VTSDHLGELLSAHLDGELNADETTAVEAHLAECEVCRSELAATSDVRAALRAAPAVDPPFGFYERLLRAGRRPRWTAVGAVGAVAAAWIVVLGFAIAPERARVAPPVDSARASLTNTKRVEVSIVPAPVDWSQLKNGLRRPIAGLPGQPWESTDPGPKALVYEADGTTVMVVGDVSTDQLEQTARDVGGRSDRSVLDHLRDAAASVLDAFSLR
jgi:anti-sigma factor RsiW